MRFFRRFWRFGRGERRWGRIPLEAGAGTVPEARRLEFNEATVGFYGTLDAGRAMAFMASCPLDPALEAELLDRAGRSS